METLTAIGFIYLACSMAFALVWACGAGFLFRDPPKRSLRGRSHHNRNNRKAQS